MTSSAQPWLPILLLIDFMSSFNLHHFWRISWKVELYLRSWACFNCRFLVCCHCQFLLENRDIFLRLLKLFKFLQQNCPLSCCPCLERTMISTVPLVVSPIHQNKSVLYCWNYEYAKTRQMSHAWSPKHWNFKPKLI